MPICREREQKVLDPDGVSNSGSVSCVILVGGPQVFLSGLGVLQSGGHIGESRHTNVKFEFHTNKKKNTNPAQSPDLFRAIILHDLLLKLHTMSL